MAGVNPFDHITSGTRDVMPLPYMVAAAGRAETSGEIEKIGEHVSRLKKSVRVIVYKSF